eukprot:4710211-Amphidinium_carterae.1
MATLAVLPHEIRVSDTSLVWQDNEPCVQWTVSHSLKLSTLLQNLTNLQGCAQNHAVTEGQPPLTDLVDAQAVVATASEESGASWQKVSDSALAVIGQGLSWDKLPGPPRISAQPKSLAVTQRRKELHAKAATSEVANTKKQESTAALPRPPSGPPPPPPKA